MTMLGPSSTCDTSQGDRSTTPWRRASPGRPSSLASHVRSKLMFWLHTLKRGSFINTTAVSMLLSTIHISRRGLDTKRIGRNSLLSETVCFAKSRPVAAPGAIVHHVQIHSLLEFPQRSGAYMFSRTSKICFLSEYLSAIFVVGPNFSVYSFMREGWRHRRVDGNGSVSLLTGNAGIISKNCLL